MLKKLLPIIFLFSSLACFNLYAGEKENIHKECLDLGFKVNTIEHAKCKLELLILSRKISLQEKQVQAAEAQARAAEANAKANKRSADIARSEKNQRTMEKGLKSLSGKCNLMMGNC